MFSRSDRTTLAVVCVLALASLAVWAGCSPSGSSSQKREAELSGYAKVSLSDLNASPKDFLHRKVRFEAYFAGKSDVYLPFRTPFTQTDFVNFAVWPVGARLWLAAEKDAAMSTMYVPRDSGEIIDRNPERLLQKLDGFALYQTIAIYGTVVAESNGMALIEVEAFRPAGAAAYTDESIRRLQLASDWVDRKQYVAASRDYAAALALGVPADAEGYVRRDFGLCRMAVEDYAGAAAELSAAAKMGAADDVALVALAEAQIELGRYAEAEKTAQAAVVKNPRSVPARAALAIALGNQMKIAAALDECAYALKLSSNDADALRAQGRVFAASGKDRLTAAIECYSKAVESRPTDVRLQRELGMLYMKKEDFASAKQCFDNVITISKADDPNYCRGCCLQAEALLGLKNPVEAANSYLSAQKRDATYVPAFMGLGALFAAGGEEKKAIEQYVTVGERLDPKGENGFQAWKAAAELSRAKPENMAKAVEFYEKAVAIKKDYLTLLDLASARWEQPKPELSKVIDALRKASELKPGELAPHYRLGVALNESGDVAGAAAELESAKKINPLDVPTLLRLGQTYRRMSRDDAAIREFESAFKIDPANASVKNSLAYVLADSGQQADLQRAEKLASEAVTAKPGESNYQDTLGWTMARLGKVKEAQAMLEKSANASGNTAVFYHLGYAYAADKQYDKAAAALDKAVLCTRQGKQQCQSCKDLAAAITRLQDKVKRELEAAKAATKPVEVKKPVDTKKPADAPKPVDTKKPADAKAPAAAPATK